MIKKLLENIPSLVCLSKLRRKNHHGSLPHAAPDLCYYDAKGYDGVYMRLPMEKEEVIELADLFDKTFSRARSEDYFSPDEFETILKLLEEISDRIKENQKKAKAKEKNNNTALSPSSTILQKGSSGGASVTPKKKTLKGGVDPINSQV
jgi:hypothetical protein